MEPLNHRNISKFTLNSSSSNWTSDSPVEIKKESFLEKKIYESEIAKEKTTNGALKFGGITFLVLSIMGLIIQVPEFFIAGAVFLGISFLVILVNALFDDTIILKAGLSGEQILRDKLRNILSSNYKVIYNYPTPYGDIDALVVGPAGVFVLEVKHHKGYITVDQNGWRRQKVGQGGTVYDAPIGNPEKQAKRNTWFISNILRQYGINIWVDYYVIFTNPEVKLNIKKEGGKIIYIEELDKFFGDSTKVTKLNDREVDRILEVLNV